MNSEEFLKQINLKIDKKNKLFKINGGEKIYIYNDNKSSSIIQHDEIYKILYNTYAKALRMFWLESSVDKDAWIVFNREDTIGYMFDKLFIEILKEVDKLREENRDVCVVRKRIEHYSMEVDFDYLLLKLNFTLYDFDKFNMEKFDGVEVRDYSEYDQ